MSALADVTNRRQSAGRTEEIALSAISELKDLNRAKAAMMARVHAIEAVSKGKSAGPVATATSSAGYTRLLKAMNELNNAYDELEQAEIEEGTVEQENEDQNNSDRANALCPSTEAIQVEIEKSQEILRNLQEQKAETDQSLSEKVIKRDQVVLATKLQKDEFEKKIKTGGDGTIAKASKRVEAQLEQKEKEHTLKMISMSEDKVVLDALLDGMKKMNGIVDFEVPSEMQGNSLPITVEFSTGFRAVIRLGGADMSLDVIEVLAPATGCHVSLDPSTLGDLVVECKELPAPNDLRHAIFCLYAAPLAPSKLAEHVAELRKRCLVKSKGPLSLEFTMSNDLTATLTVHSCYPNVPAGVSVASLQGGSRWTTTEVEALKIEANSMCFSTVFFMYDYLDAK